MDARRWGQKDVFFQAKRTQAKALRREVEELKEGWVSRTEGG